MNDYELRFMKTDGSPTLIYQITALSDQAAITTIESMDRLDYDIVEVWQSSRCVHAEKSGSKLRGPEPESLRWPVRRAS